MSFSTDKALCATSFSHPSPSPPKHSPFTFSSFLSDTLSSVPSLPLPSPLLPSSLCSFAAFPNEPDKAPSHSRVLESTSKHAHTPSLWGHLQEFFRAVWKSFHNFYFMLFLLVSGIYNDAITWVIAVSTIYTKRYDVLDETVWSIHEIGHIHCMKLPIQGVVT